MYFSNISIKSAPFSGSNPSSYHNTFVINEQKKQNEKQNYRVRFLNPLKEVAYNLNDPGEEITSNTQQTFTNTNTNKFFISEGYTGFTSASAHSSSGFLLYSGSVLSHLTDDYSNGGVGLELVATSESFFRFRTNPSELNNLLVVLTEIYKFHLQNFI